MFLTEYGSAILKLLYVYVRTGQTNKYTIASESQATYQWRKKLQANKAQMNPVMLNKNLRYQYKLMVFTIYTGR